MLLNSFKKKKKKISIELNKKYVNYNWVEK